jgi:hypothetical protein
VARCPAHQDGHPSLSIAEQGDRILVHCFAGCSQEAVIDALRALGLWPQGTGALPRLQRDPDRADVERAEHWRTATQALVDKYLEELPLADPARGVLTSLARVLCNPSPAALVGDYRGFRARDAALAASLVRAGRLRNARLQRRLAEFIVSERFAQ